MERVIEFAQWLYLHLHRVRRLLATTVVALLALALAWHVIFGTNGMMTYQHKRAQYRQLQRQINDLQLQNEQLQQDIEKLRSDPQTIERQAREQLRYARPGEVIYTLPAAKPARPPAEASAPKR